MPRSSRSRGNGSRGSRSRSNRSRGNRSRSDGLVPGGLVPGGSGAWRTELYRDTTWVVRPVSGPRAVKDYRCPGCDQEIRAGVPHVVVWPFDGPVGLGDGVTDRRHWHTPCWAARERRGGRR